MPGTLLPRLQPACYGAVALLLSANLHAADWITLRGAGVELVSDASERTARQAVQRLVEIQSLLPQSDSSAVPLRVFLFAKESEYRAYAPNATASGFYQSGFERDYVGMYAGGQLPRVVAHEYVHFAAHQRGVTRPAWLEEGLAEFYSSFDGRQVGAPIPEHLKLLEQPWHTAQEMNAPGSLDTMFYAQSWALVHMLRREPQFPERVTDQILVQLRLYLKTMRATAVKSAPPSTPPVSLERVSALNALLLRADFALHSQKPELARMLYTQAANAFPNSSVVETGLGTLAYGTGDNPGARAHLKRALELNDRDALAWFELGLMEDDPAALEKAAQLNPNLAEAHVLLGVRATDDGDLGAALQHLEQATRLLPRKSYAWYSLGYAQLKRGDSAGARRSLEQALATATSPEQHAMAATLLDSFSN